MLNVFYTMLLETACAHYVVLFFVNSTEPVFESRVNGALKCGNSFTATRSGLSPIGRSLSAAAESCRRGEASNTQSRLHYSRSRMSHKKDKKPPLASVYRQHSIFIFLLLQRH
jgi:hypothetical protein